MVLSAINVRSNEVRAGCCGGGNGVAGDNERRDHIRIFCGDVVPSIKLQGYAFDVKVGK